MADPVPNGNPPAPPEVAAPPVATPQPPPAVEAAAVPAAPVEVAAPAVEAAPAPAVEVAAPAPTPSLLETAAAEEPAKPADEVIAPAPASPKPEEPKPAEAAAPPAVEAAPAEPAAPEPPAAVDYKYELPEGMALPDEAKTALHGVLDAWRADPANVQPLIDYHAQRLNDQAQFIAQEQHRVFGETKAGWRREVMGDEVLGGAGHQTSMGAVARVRNQFISDHQQGTDGWKKDVESFVLADQMTGFGDNPTVLRFLHRIARFLDEPAVASPDIKPAPQPRPRGGAPLYDNPRSTFNGRE